MPGWRFSHSRHLTVTDFAFASSTLVFPGIFDFFVWRKREARKWRLHAGRVHAFTRAFKLTREPTQIDLSLCRIMMLFCT